MLRNMKTRSKILSGFGSVIIVSCIIVIILLTEISGLADTTQQLYDKPYAASDAMWNVRRNLVDTQRALYKLISVTNESDISTTKQTIQQDFTNLNDSIAKLESSFTSNNKITLLTQIKNKISEAVPIKEEIISLASQNKNKEATELILDKYEPVFNEVNNLVLELFELVSQDAVNFVDEAHNGNNRALFGGILLLIIGVIIAVFITIKITKAMVDPINQITEAAIEMSKGHLNAKEKITYESKDELGILAKSLLITMTNLSDYVNEISENLKRISMGDLTQRSDNITDFLGDFESIKESFMRILKNFNTTLTEINQSSEQVTIGSQQMANASQALSQGATEQASSMEELSNSISEISDQVTSNAGHSKNASEKANSVGNEIIESNKKMQDMIRAMTDIEENSNEINKIIKTIEDIAFQTNILALNAAVEAARAGVAGKGFAVVADEVRNLASKSAEAASSTTILIENAVNAIENGTKIADETANSLLSVVEGAKDVANTVDKISIASSQQANSIIKIKSSMEQISSVVQNNSATAEESAASSQELSAQAQNLNKLVERFHLFKQIKKETSYQTINQSNPIENSNTKY